ncbi:DUF4215 domain-containing protein [Candidatus Parcubacteria bacterium]|nr:MAG: DUF4215 domain-containing protein [Candidatus Parcubacteria bacterium]
MKKISKIKFALFILILSAGFMLSNNAWALDTGLAVLSQSGLGTRDLRVIVMSIVNVALGFLAVIAVLLILYGGFVWMTAAGNEQKIETAKRILVNAVIGLLIILLSFAITTFILNQLLEATGVRDVCTDTNNPGDIEPCADNPPGCPRERVCQTDGYWGDCYISDQLDPQCPALPQCIVYRIIPDAPLPTRYPRNTAVDVEFNYDVSSFNANSILVTDTATGTGVTGTITQISGRRLRFIPDTPCPSPYGSLFCFDSNSDFNIQVQNVNCGGYAVTCPDCDAEFHTSDIIDLAEPTIDIVEAHYCENNFPPDDIVAAQVADDVGIRRVDFFYNTGTGPLSILPSWYGSPTAPFDTSAAADTSWQTTGLAAGTPVTISATVEDFDLHQASDSFNTTILAEHCCNNLQDSDELGTDCGGNDCAACDGSACDFDTATPACQPDDDSCASGFCETTSCTCQSRPQIDYISPADPGSLDTYDDDTPYGPPGSMITIFGSGFGSYVSGNSRVDFSSGAGWVQAQLASSVNPACGNVWQDNQIIAIVPAGSDANAVIRVTEGESGFNMQDLSNDGFGRIINLFTVGGNARPGICALVPPNGVFEDLIDIEGAGLTGFVSTDRVSFGEIDGTDPSGVSNTTLSGAGVPNLSVGTTVRTWVEISGQPSNALNFYVNNPDLIPIIYDFNPKSGPAGTYVTITGDNFGNFRGAGSVSFGAVEAIYDFPAECRDKTWTDTQIIVKVPALSVLDDYVITVINNDLFPDTTSDLADPDFEFNDDFLPPGICLMSPDNGPAGRSTVVYGENFNSVVESVVFSQERTDDVITINVPGGDKAEYITDVEVQLGSITGPVVARDTDVPGDSNPYQFIVGDCTEGTNTCGGTTPECCFGGPYKGSCMEQGECTPKASRSFYLWQFTTGSPGPQVIELCNRQDDCQLGYCQEDAGVTCRNDLDCPLDSETNQNTACLSSFSSPTPWSERDSDIPVNAVVSARFSQDMRDSTVNTSNIIVQECSGAPVNGTLSVFQWPWQGDKAEGFIFTPSAAFNPATCYRVTLTIGLQNSSGSALAEEYVWEFTTRNNSDLGNIGCVSCEPSLKTMTFRGQTENYAGMAYDENQVCVVLDATQYGWVWETDPPPPGPPYYASITSNDADGDSLTDPLQQAEAISESMPDYTEIISSVPDAGQSGICELYTDFSTPVIIDRWPDCASACLNAETGAAFSRALDLATVISGNLGLYTCFGDSSCSDLSSPVSITEPVYFESQYNTCGDAVLDMYEECDDGNIISGDGCSDNCLNEGSIYTCGSDGDRDGSLTDIFEDCDDGNRVSGDGCSSLCLNEGADSAGSGGSCGNGSLDPGEECETGELNCTTRCLHAGATDTERYEIYFYPLATYNNGLFIPGSYYRVVFSDNILSDEGISLGNLNFDSDADNINDSYSWIFRAQEDFSLCALSRVAVNPGNITLPTNVIHKYRGVPYSTPDLCSPQYGQRLNPYTYEWTWISTQPSAADIITDAGVLGSDGGNLRDACGNMVIEAGEECDDGNISSGDGCSDNCLNEGSTYSCGVSGNQAINPGFEIIVAP